jgi:hypothetical protein
VVSHSHVNVYQRVDGENPIDGKNSLATHQLLKIQLYRFPEDELIGEAVKGLKPSPTVLPDMIRSMVCTCKSKASKPRTSQRAGAVASLLKDVFQKNRKDAERCPNLPKSYSRNNCDTVLGIYELSENPGPFCFQAPFKPPRSQRDQVEAGVPHHPRVSLANAGLGQCVTSPVRLEIAKMAGTESRNT